MIFCKECLLLRVCFTKLRLLSAKRNCSQIDKIRKKANDIEMIAFDSIAGQGKS